jgi:hypothetical protein
MAVHEYVPPKYVSVGDVSSGTILCRAGNRCTALVVLRGLPDRDWVVYVTLHGL